MSENLLSSDFISLRIRETESLIRQLIKIRQTHTIEKLSKHPAPGKWSAVQVVEHLVNYNRYYLPAIEKQIQKPSAKIASVYYKPGWLGAYFTKLMLPEKKDQAVRKMQSPKDFRPVNLLEPDHLMDEFIEGEKKLITLLEKSRKLNLGHIRVPISLSPFIRLQLGDTFHFLVAHQRRHFIQIENALNSIIIPEPSNAH